MEPLISRQTSAGTPPVSLISRSNSSTYGNPAFDSRPQRLEQHVHFEIAPPTSASITRGATGGVKTEVDYHTLQEPSNVYGAPNRTPSYAQVNRISINSNGYPSYDTVQPIAGAANRMPYTHVKNRVSEVYAEYPHPNGENPLTYDRLQRFDVGEQGMMPSEPTGYAFLQDGKQNVKFMDGCDDIYY